MCDVIVNFLEMYKCGHYLRMCWGIIAGLFLLFSFWVNLAEFPGLLRGFDPRGQQKQEDLKLWFQLTVTCYSMLTINTLPVSFFFTGITRDLLKSSIGFHSWVDVLSALESPMPSSLNGSMSVLLHILFNSVIVHFFQICCRFGIAEYLINVCQRGTQCLKWMKLTMLLNCMLLVRKSCSFC